MHLESADTQTNAGPNPTSAEVTKQKNNLKPADDSICTQRHKPGQNRQWLLHKPIMEWQSEGQKH